MTKIKSILGREILDSRGNPTVEVEMSDGEFTVLAKVPSGASTGIHEALELRDRDLSRYNGKGVFKAVENINKIIAPKVCNNFVPTDQEKIDNFLIALDGTENKSVLGANAILGVSLAASRLAAKQKKIELFEYINSLFGGEMSLPRPMMNVINGGKHADSGLSIQEFMIFPKQENFRENLRAGAEIFQKLRTILSKKGLATSVGDEGGFAPKISRTSAALSTIMEATIEAGYENQIDITMDPAASEFFGEQNGALKNHYLMDGKNLSSENLAKFYGNLVSKFPITSIEDSHSEDDFSGFRTMMKLYGEQIQLVGDDLFVTNSKRLESGIEQKLANSILIKANQIGTLTETLSTMKMAKENNLTCIISHRSGETSDDFIADLAVGTDAGQIKTGSLSRSERIAKYNRLLRIEEKL